MVDQNNQQNQNAQNMPPPPPQRGTKGSAPQPPQGAAPNQEDSSVSNEELIEAIIDEKWNELEKDIKTIINWKNNAEKRLATMEEKIKGLKDDFDKLQQSVTGKVGEYDKHIENVSSEIQAMEKVFAKVLPVFTKKVDQLSQISDDLKHAVKPGESDDTASDTGTEKPQSSIDKQNE